METHPALGFAHFVAHADTLGKAILFVLIAMSIATWYGVVVKTIDAIVVRRRGARFLGAFRRTSSLRVLKDVVEQLRARDPFSSVARHALAAAQHRAMTHAADVNADRGEFVLRAVRRGLDEEGMRLQSGLSVFASIGSTAPFVGLLGTVWGVYQALVTIGMTGQGTLDQVAGPVGEALIMTGLGLAVAIPAVLAYNFTVRSNRTVLARLDSYAYDLHTFLTTGSHLHGPGVGAPVAAKLAEGTA